jgi:hypothetical protein
MYIEVMTRTPDVTRVGKRRAEARLMVDARGQIREASEAAHRLLYYGAEALVGRSIRCIVPSSRQALLGALGDVFVQGVSRNLPGVLLARDGSLVGVVVTAQPQRTAYGRALALSIEPDDEPTTLAFASLEDASASGNYRAHGERALSPSKPTRLSARPPMPSRVVPARTRKAQQAAGSVDIPEQLAACRAVLRWLEAQLRGAPPGPRERALAHLVLEEASSLIELCRRTLRT